MPKQLEASEWPDGCLNIPMSLIYRFRRKRLRFGSMSANTLMRVSEFIAFDGRLTCRPLLTVLPV